MGIKIGDSEVDIDAPAFCKKCRRRFFNPSKNGKVSIKTNPVTKKAVISFTCGQCLPKPKNK